MLIRIRLLTVATAVALAVALTMAAVATVGDGPTEGMGVQGHWTIDVHDADGTVVASREFHNAFVGPQILAGILSGEWAFNRTADGVPNWRVRANSVTGEGLCERNGARARCVMVLPGESQDTNEFDTLEITNNGDTLTLQGSFEATFAGSVTNVQTLTRLDTPLGTQAFTSETFDDTDASTDNDTIAVSAGQFVTVTVDLAFPDAPA